MHVCMYACLLACMHAFHTYVQSNVYARVYLSSYENAHIHTWLCDGAEAAMTIAYSSSILTNKMAVGTVDATDYAQVPQQSFIAICLLIGVNHVMYLIS